MDKIIPKLGDSLDLCYIQDQGYIFCPIRNDPFFSAAISVWCAKKSGLCFILLKARLLVSTQLAKRIRPRD